MGIIISDSIEQDSLNLISLYTDTDYTKKRIIKAYGGLKPQRQTRVANLIKSFLDQANSFLLETDKNIFSAPLTLFYAINNYSKAVFYANIPNENIAGTHGIELADSDDEIEKISSLGDIKLKVNFKGAFSSLVKVTGDDLKANDVIQLKDIFSLVPELRELYYARYAEEPNIFLLQPIGIKATSYEVYFQSDDIDAINRRDFSLMLNNSLHFKVSKTYGYVICDGNTTEERKRNAMYSDVFGNVYCTNGISVNSRRIKISKLVCLYICFYAFSMMVRYHPDNWKKFCDSVDVGIIKKLLINCRREMLVEVLQLLSGENYSFATKIYPIEDGLDGGEVLRVLKKELKQEKNMTGKNPLLNI